MKNNHKKRVHCTLSFWENDKDSNITLRSRRTRFRGEFVGHCQWQQIRLRMPEQWHQAHPWCVTSLESKGKLVIESGGGRLGKLHHAYASLCRCTGRGFGLVLYSVMDGGRANERGDEKGTWGKIICKVKFMVLFVLRFNWKDWKDWKQQFFVLQREYLLPVGLFWFCGLFWFFFSIFQMEWLTGFWAVSLEFWPLRKLITSRLITSRSISPQFGSRSDLAPILCCGQISLRWPSVFINLSFSWMLGSFWALGLV